jgi:hypothetical protein
VTFFSSRFFAWLYATNFETLFAREEFLLFFFASLGFSSCSFVVMILVFLCGLRVLCGETVFGCGSATALLNLVENLSAK